MTGTLSFPARRPLEFATFVAAVAALALALAPTARADAIKPVIVLGPSTVANGVATVSGQVGGSPLTGAHLTINGQPVALSFAGDFSGSFNLNGESALTMVLSNPLTGDIATIKIPLTLNVLGPGGVIPTDALSSLERAAVSIVEPLGGFRILDELPLTVVGRVADRGELDSMTVNGRNVLSALGPNGGFMVQLPGSTREVAVTVKDREGVAQTTIMPVAHVSSIIRTRPGSTVSAAGALGLHIASVRFYTNGVKARKRIRMTVTIKDRRGLLVRDAIVSVRSARARRVVGGPQIKLSNRTGRATFVFRLRRPAFGKRLIVFTIARTPNARAKKTSAVRVPRLSRRVSARHHR